MNILDKYNKQLSASQKQAIDFCTELADDMDIKIYLVGGIVRDILLERQFNDIDILIEYDAIIFAELLEQKYPAIIEIKQKNAKFKTAKLQFTIGSDVFETDVASTRSEVYEYPSALPILAETCVPLKKDIFRRDFTVNSLVMSLRSKDFAEVYDETGYGLEDLKNKAIRILHPDSFFDDPSRIVRGLKYRTKLKFVLEENTEILQQDCLKSGKFDNDCQKRIKKEVIETLNIISPYMFDKFISEKIYKLIISDVGRINLPSGNLICEIIQNSMETIIADKVWLVFLAVIFNFAPQELVKQNIKKLALNKQEQKILTDFFVLMENVDKIDSLTDNYSVYKFFNKYSNEAIVATQCVVRNPDYAEITYLYLKKLQNIKLSVSGKDIEKFNIEQGVIYNQILEATLKEKLNQNLSTEEEKIYFKHLCKNSYIKQ